MQTVRYLNLHELRSVIPLWVLRLLFSIVTIIVTNDNELKEPLELNYWTQL